MKQACFEGKAKGRSDLGTISLAENWRVFKGLVMLVNRFLPDL